MNRRDFLSRSVAALSIAAAAPVLAALADKSTPVVAKMSVGQWSNVEFLKTETIELYRAEGALWYSDPLPWIVHYHTRDEHGHPEFEYATLFSKYPTTEELAYNRELAAAAFYRAHIRKYGVEA